MVGEIRDNETAGLAVQAALTGHIVLSTLHTNNSAGVIPRLIDMKVEAFLLPVSLSLVIAQRLIGVLCPDCKAPEAAAPQVQELIKRSLVGVPQDVTAAFSAPYQIYHAKGCATCKGHGVVGRTGIYEAFLMTPEFEDAGVRAGYYRGRDYAEDSKSGKGSGDDHVTAGRRHKSFEGRCRDRGDHQGDRRRIK
jgi:type II secretory ATPase GspE/PulE/Tfp pilus assembly ATPase PilB-like protein